MSDAPQGLRLETAAGILARELITDFFTKFGPVVQFDRASSQTVVAAFVDGLTGAMAYTIAGKHGSKEEVLNATIKILREGLDRDLRHLGQRP